jgi:hypothetical protein
MTVKIKFRSAKEGGARPRPRKQPTDSSWSSEIGMKEGPAQGFGPGPQLKADLRFQIEAQRGSGGAAERTDPRRILK